MPRRDSEKGPLVLVVDDEPDIVEYLSEVLGDHGYRPAGFTDAEEALEAARAAPPELVILDVMMPGRTGLFFYRKFRSLPGGENVPILFVSGAAREEDFEAGLPPGWSASSLEGPHAFLEKPLAVDRLLSVLRGFLGGGGP